jgi:hypothetical protein
MFLQSLEDPLEKEELSKTLIMSQKIHEEYIVDRCSNSDRKIAFIKLKIQVTDTTSDIFISLYRLGNSQQS